MARRNWALGFAVAALLLSGSAGIAQSASAPHHAGSAACAECHADETRDWASSDHAWALKEPDATSVLGDFNDARFTHKGVTTRFFRKDGKYLVETEGGSGKPETFEIRYTVGHRPLQQYLVETIKGRLQVLDIAWDVGAAKWFHLYPGQDLPAGDGMHWTGSYKNWQARCATCHQTGFDKGYDFPSRTYASHWAELTVGCETCHGPAEAHVAWARKPVGDDPYKATAPKLGPGHQAAEIDVCGPCHAYREAFSQKQPVAGASFHDNYALSLLTPDLYFGDGQQKAEVFILGSFLQSKMKAKGVTCSNCHAPHSGKLVAEGNAVCTQCHSEAGNASFPSLRKADYDNPAHHHHLEGSKAAQCVSCHMPERTYMQIDPRRDHFFRRPDPLQSKSAGAPDVCTGCHTEKTAEWASQAIADWHPAGTKDWQDRSALIVFDAGARTENSEADLAAYARDIARPAIVRATAVGMLGTAGALTATDATALTRDGDPLVRTAAAGALRSMDVEDRIALLRPLLADPARAVRQKAAVELAGAGVAALPSSDDAAYREGLRAYMDARLANADTPESHMAIGGLALSRRQWDDAEAAFATAAEMDPQLTRAWSLLAQIRAARGNAKGAEDALSAALAASPRNVELLMARGDLALRGGSGDGALTWYKRAEAVDPARADLWLAQAFAYAVKNDRAAAQEAANRALSLSPGLTLPPELAQYLQSPQ